ncbi:MAG TPA: hypothetical protein PKA38_04245 [Candidatus Levybacteria bacterium]|nr:hypothetical protein [Candidatus Levybacteria bacterium]
MKQPLKSTKGEAEFLIIFVIIVGAFLLVGGQFLFQAENSKKNNGNTNDTTAPQTPPENDWKIELPSDVQCDNANNTSNVSLAFHGTAPGYYKIEVKSGEVFTPITVNSNIYNTFEPNQQNIQVNDLILSNTNGFNTKPWRATLYEGGTPSGNDLTGGTLKAEKEFEKTNCT